MKRLIIIFSLVIYSLIIRATDDPACKIIIYRAPNFYGAALSYKILLNDSLIIRIRNNAYYEHNVEPGKYVIQVAGLDETIISFDIQVGETRYFRFVLGAGFWAGLPDLVMEEPVSAEKSIDRENMIQQLYVNEILPRPKNRIGFDVQVGVGIENIPMVTLTNGDEADISFGGGIGIGAYYGYEVNRYLDLEVDLNILFSDLVPYVENAQVTFRRLSAKFTPSLIIPFDGGYSMRLKLGAGVGIYGLNLLNIQTNELQGGFEDRWHYDNRIGPHARIVYEMNPSRNFTISYGFSYYYVKYNYHHSDGFIFPDGNELTIVDGSGVNLILGLSYNF
jgi:hypothetical protein